MPPTVDFLALVYLPLLPWLNMNDRVKEVFHDEQLSFILLPITRQPQFFA